MATTRAGGQILDRLAAAPISWGVCEVPGWGVQLAPERVLSEMRALGIAATEAGPDGWLGSDPAHVRALLRQYGLELVGGFLPVVLHDGEQLEASLDKVRRTSAAFADLGASVLSSALIFDDDWGAPRPLTDREWAHLLGALPLVDEIAGEYGITHVLHPHWGTLIERDAEVRRIIGESSVFLCLDTGHLTLGGTDPALVAAEFPERVAHAHLKDVDARIAARLRLGELTIVQAAQAGLFRPLGSGDAGIRQAVLALEHAGYDGWYVLEQDIALTAEPGQGTGPPEEVRRSIDFLQALARDDSLPVAAADRT